MVGDRLGEPGARLIKTSPCVQIDRLSPKKTCSGKET